MTENKPSSPVVGNFGSVELHGVRTIIIPRRSRKARHFFLACDIFPDGLHVPTDVIDPKDVRRLSQAIRSMKTRDEIADVGTIRVLRWWYEGQTTGITTLPPKVETDIFELGTPVRPRSKTKLARIPVNFNSTPLILRKLSQTGTLIQPRGRAKATKQVRGSKK